jgi:hypothetical protein
MTTLLSLIKMAAVLLGGLLLGRMFFAEVKQAKEKRAPWYAPFLSAPGILTLLALLLPVFFWAALKLGWIGG